MSLDTSAVGYETTPHELTYDWRTLATYALGIGAKRDELAYLYEGHKGGMRVCPTFGVVPAYPVIADILARSAADLAMVVHGGQSVRAHRAIPAAGTLSTVGTLEAIYDMKKFARMVIKTCTTADGEPIVDTTSSIIFRGGGGFGGRRPAESDAGVAVPKDRPPDFTRIERTSAEQALLYRISGDANPLHADPEFAAMVGFAQGPILHGLCTFGFAARAVVREAAGGDARQLRSLTTQFRKPVWPGDTLVTQGWFVGDGKVALVVRVEERPDPVMTGAWAQLG